MNNFSVTLLIVTWTIVGLFTSIFAVPTPGNHAYAETHDKLVAPVRHVDQVAYAAAISKFAALLSAKYNNPTVDSRLSRTYPLEQQDVTPSHSGLTYVRAASKVGSIAYAPTIRQMVSPSVYTPTIANFHSPTYTSNAPGHQSPAAVTVTYTATPARVVPPLVYASKETYANAIRAIAKNGARRPIYTSPPASYDDSTTNAFVAPITKIATAPSSYTMYMYRH
ncbi:unnamed protein product [Allacma fusca]|uniref:Cuticle protein n=1 Tax=Allacma fusca TaxID=39272 RepID=A0A8J2KVQ8_9HEXA|nr:unnamed protein product [Allacma fusca]